MDDKGPGGLGERVFDKAAGIEESPGIADRTPIGHANLPDPLGGRGHSDAFEQFQCRSVNPGSVRCTERLVRSSKNAAGDHGLLWCRSPALPTPRLASAPALGRSNRNPAPDRCVKRRTVNDPSWRDSGNSPSATERRIPAHSCGGAGDVRRYRIRQVPESGNAMETWRCRDARPRRESQLGSIHADEVLGNRSTRRELAAGSAENVDELFRTFRE